VNYPRRQQFRRLVRFGETAIVAAGLALLAFATAADGAWFLAIVLSGAALMVLGMARRWLSLAHRSRIGARSEVVVQRGLDVLRGEGWRLRHSLTWRGRGDIDSVAIAPTGIAVADRDEDENLRRRPPCSRTPAGRMAFAAPTEVESQRRPCGAVRRAGAQRRAGGG
jgi:hypothetical protein